MAAVSRRNVLADTHTPIKGVGFNRNPEQTVVLEQVKLGDITVEIMFKTRDLHILLRFTFHTTIED